MDTKKKIRLTPPKLALDLTAPFKDALYEREAFGEHLRQLLLNTEEGLVLFLNAPWGEGKTEFAKMWRTRIRTEFKLETIYFDAYAADYFEDPFLCFSGEIIGLLKRLGSESGSNDGGEKFKKAAIKFGSCLGGIGAKALLRAATLNTVSHSDINKLTKIVIEESEKAGEKYVEQKLASYEREKDALNEFKKTLKEVAAAYRKKHGFPLTIIVDELDRCRPDYALSLLERIKHLFDVEGVAFILLVNQAQIENYVRSVYGCNDARAYLLKFATLFVDLPRRATNIWGVAPANHKTKFCRKLFDHYGFLVRDDESGGTDFTTTVALLADYYDLSLRDLEKMFSTMAVYYAAKESREHNLFLLVVYLVFVKMKKPIIYEGIESNSIEYRNVAEASKLPYRGAEKVKTAVLGRLDGFLQYGLLPSSDLANLHASSEAKKVESYLSLIQTERESYISKICREIDRFKLS